MSTPTPAPTPDSFSSLSRFCLVSPFYGPGNITAWLCTLCSVLVTWCFNAEYRRNDSISADFIAALTIPTVAAAHAIYLIFFRRPDLGDQETVDIYRLFTGSEPTIVQHAAAAEAALTVCETFATVAVALMFIGMWNFNLKRTLCVIAVGLLAFSAESIVFLRTGGIDLSDSNLSRPFSFDFPMPMVSILSFLGVWMAVFLLLLAWLWIRGPDYKPQNTHLEDPNLRPGSPSRLAPSIDMSINAKILALASIFVHPMMFATIGPGATGGLGVTEFMLTRASRTRLIFFIPKSSTSMTELDQVVAVSIGILTLLFSVWQAVASRSREKGDGACES
ncbi:hypothetical protein FALCPG4_015052 [Fusarium falciforme]